MTKCHPGLITCKQQTKKFFSNAIGCSHIGEEFLSLETTVLYMMVNHQQLLITFMLKVFLCQIYCVY